MYDESDLLKTIEECDLNNRPMYKRLYKHLKDNDQQLNSDKDEINFEEQLATKTKELNNLKRSDDAKKLNSSINPVEVYEEFIDKIKSQQDNQTGSEDENGSRWETINTDIDKELKSLEMIQSFINRNKADDLKEYEINESALVRANDILKHFYEKN